MGPGRPLPPPRPTHRDTDPMATRYPLPILLLYLAALAAAPAYAWDGPAPGLPAPIGSHANGCIAGAAALPAEGPGYQAVNPGRRRTFGHPELVDFVKGLAAQSAEAGLGTLRVGDLSAARGGRLPGTHASHQTGLDVDVWLEMGRAPLPPGMLDGYDFPPLVDAATRRLDPQRYGPAQTALVRLATGDGRVTRVFVNPAIKLALCQSAGEDRDWLRKVRPWFGHAAHIHVRLACPADAAACVDQGPPPEGDGCGEELAGWLEPPPGTPPARPPAPPPEPPAACLDILGLAGGQPGPTPQPTPAR